MSATITTLFVPVGMPIVELIINDGNKLTTTYPQSFDHAVESLISLGIENVEYDEIVDSRLLHTVE